MLFISKNICRKRRGHTRYLSDDTQEVTACVTKFDSHRSYIHLCSCLDRWRRVVSISVSIQALSLLAKARWRGSGMLLKGFGKSEVRLVPYPTRNLVKRQFGLL